MTPLRARGLLWRWLALLAICGAALAIGILAFGRPLPLGPVSVDDLRSRPHAHLFYPGSRILRTFARPEDRHVGDGPLPASIETDLVADATPEKILSWYEVELGKQGWRSGGVTGPIHTYLRGSRERFNVAILNSFPAGIPPDVGTPFLVAYQIDPWCPLAC